MCVVSAVGDNWTHRFPTVYPSIPVGPWVTPSQIQNNVTRDEFNRLKHDVEELKKLLEAAKRYDEATGQPDCHMDEKVELIKKIAEAVGVDISTVFK